MIHCSYCKIWCQFITSLLKPTSWYPYTLGAVVHFWCSWVIKSLANFSEWSYPCYAGNLERWQCPARPHWLPAHWSGVSCECVPRLTLMGGRSTSAPFTRNHRMNAFPHTDTNNWLHTRGRAHALQECLKINKGIWYWHPAAAIIHWPPLSFSNTR